MEDIYNTSQDNSYNYRNITNDDDGNIIHDDYYYFLLFQKVVTYIIVCIGLFILGVLLLLPFPLLIFSLVGTLKALSASISVPSEEKRRIVGMLVLVLLIYTLLFLPSIILCLVERFDNTLVTVFLVFVKLSPLADLVLYVFMKKGTIDKLLASVCCCRMDSNDTEMGLPAGCGDTSGAGSALSSPPLSGQAEQQM